MERAGKTIAKLRNMPGIQAEDLVISAWIAAIGERLASRAMASCLVRDRLVIDVEDKVWQQQFYQLRSPILAKLSELLGPGIVNELEFRVKRERLNVPRMPPRSAVSAGSASDSDGIADPVLRMLYRGAKKKAL